MHPADQVIRSYISLGYKDKDAWVNISRVNSINSAGKGGPRVQGTHFYRNGFMVPHFFPLFGGALPLRNIDFYKTQMIVHDTPFVGLLTSNEQINATQMNKNKNSYT